MLASALKEAKNVLLDQTTVKVDAATFQTVLAWLDAPDKIASLEQRFSMLHGQLRRNTLELSADAIQKILQS